MALITISLPGGDETISIPNPVGLRLVAAMRDEIRPDEPPVLSNGKIVKMYLKRHLACFLKRYEDSVVAASVVSEPTLVDWEN